MMMLALSRKALPMDAATRAPATSRSARSVFGFDLNGRTAMVIGVGRIGSRLIPMLRAFHINVIACDPLMSADVAKLPSSAAKKSRIFRAHLGRADMC
jgi:phosphoglycerate dehydrogenase-like enzyme